MSDNTLALACEPDAEIVITARQELHISGWDRDEISVSAVAGLPPELRREGDRFLLTCGQDCRVRVPERAQLAVGAVNAKGSVQGLRGHLAINRAGSNLILRDIAGAALQVVHGNLVAEDVAGSLEIQAVYGNASLRKVRGPLNIQGHVNGNLTLTDCGAARAQARGNITLRVNPEPGQHIHLNSGGNLHCQLPPQASAEITLTSEAGSITIDAGEGPTTLSTREHQLKLGAGEAVLNLSASGRIQLHSTDSLENSLAEAAGLTGLAEELVQQIDRQMDHLGERLNQQLSDISGEAGAQALPADEIDGILEKARAASQQAALRAQEQTQRAAQKAHDQLVRKLDKARRKAKQKVKAAHKQANKQDRSWSVRGRRAATRRAGAPVSTVTEEEQALILQMLEQGQINVEQADQLLTALEGAPGGGPGGGSD